MDICWKVVYIVACYNVITSMFKLKIYIDIAYNPLEAYLLPFSDAVNVMKIYTYSYNI